MVKSEDKKTTKVKKTVVKKSDNKNKKDKVKKEGFFTGVKKEMKLVKWPEGKAVLKNTVATVVLVVIVCGYFLLLNLLLSIVKGWLM